MPVRFTVCWPEFGGIGAGSAMGSSAGWSFTAVIVMVRVVVPRLFAAAPSFAVKVSVRTAVEGLSLEFEYVMVRSAVW